MEEVQNIKEYYARLVWTGEPRQVRPRRPSPRRRFVAECALRDIWALFYQTNRRGLWGAMLKRASRGFTREEDLVTVAELVALVVSEYYRYLSNHDFNDSGYIPWVASMYCIIFD